MGDGSVKDNCIECPFHGWKFNGSDGKCSDIPYSDTKPTYGLKMWHSIEINNGIYVWYAPDKGMPEWEITELSASDINVFHGKTEHFTSCQLQDMPENGSDVNHFNFLHKDFIQPWMKPITHIFEGTMGAV